MASAKGQRSRSLRYVLSLVSQAKLNLPNVYVNVRAYMLAKAYKYKKEAGRMLEESLRNFQSTYYSQHCGRMHKWVVVLFQSC